MKHTHSSPATPQLLLGITGGDLKPPGVWYWQRFLSPGPWKSTSKASVLSATKEVILAIWIFSGSIQILGLFYFCEEKHENLDWNYICRPLCVAWTRQQDQVSLPTNVSFHSSVYVFYIVLSFFHRCFMISRIRIFSVYRLYSTQLGLFY